MMMLKTFTAFFLICSIGAKHFLVETEDKHKGRRVQGRSLQLGSGVQGRSLDLDRDLSLKGKVAASFAKKIVSKLTYEEKKQIEHDGGIDQNELNKALAKVGIKPSAKITKKFNELDTNKNGKLEASEVSYANFGTDGEDYSLDALGQHLGPLGDALMPVIVETLKGAARGFGDGLAQAIG